jgi:hypothetical protein
MSMCRRSIGAPSRSPAPRARRPLAAALAAALLGVAAAVLVACGSSGVLIPASDAGPLKSDFEAVAQAATSGEGSCGSTEAAILKTEQDFGSLPSTLDSGLRKRLREGITNLRNRALAQCATAATTATTATAKTTTTGTTPTTPTNTETTTTPPTQTSTTETTPTQTTGTTPGGGTQAKEGSEQEAPAGGQGGGTAAGGNGQGNGE